MGSRRGPAVSDDNGCNGLDRLCGVCVRRRCAIVMDNGREPGPGWVEIQRDDCPELPEGVEHPFPTDEDAARWVSTRAREVDGAWFVPLADARNVIGEEIVGSC